MASANIQIVEAVIFGKRMSYFCDSCNRKHTHGAGEIGEQQYRISHCPKPRMVCIIPKDMV